MGISQQVRQVLCRPLVTGAPCCFGLRTIAQRQHIRALHASAQRRIPQTSTDFQHDK